MPDRLTVRGRLIGLELPPRSLLQIIDLDPILDDTLAVGWPHDDGRFELHFPSMAVRQDELEFERVPDRLRFDLFVEEGPQMLRRRAERGALAFVDGVCDLGDVVLGPVEITTDDGLVRDRRSVRRGRPTNASLVSLVDEVRPLVTRWTGRPELLDDVRIELTDNLLTIEQPDAEGLVEHLQRVRQRLGYEMMRKLGLHEVLALYSHRRDCIFVDAAVAARQPHDALATLVAHELVHMSQFRGDAALSEQLDARARANAARDAAAASGRELTRAEREAVSDAFAFTFAIEGHATAIERLLLRDRYRFGYHVLHFSGVALAMQGVVGLGVLAARAAARKVRSFRSGPPLAADDAPAVLEDLNADATAWGLFEYSRRFAEHQATGAPATAFSTADVIAARSIAAERLERTLAMPASQRSGFRQHLVLVAEELLYGMTSLAEAERQLG